VRRTTLSGLAVLVVMLGGVVVPATAHAQPTTGVRPLAAITARAAAAAPMADGAVEESGDPEISCVLATDCLGAEGSSGGDGEPAVPTRVARWNGSSWKGVGVTLPKGATAKRVDLTAVSCRGTKFCLVVGDYYKGSPTTSLSYPLTLAYNGTTLKPTAAVPLPKGQPSAALASVSCVTSRSCVAIGLADGGPGPFPTSGGTSFIETWSGTRWTLHTIGSSVNATAVSCATSSFCVLAGESELGALYFGRWNGKKLTAMRPSGSRMALVPTDVSCATPSNCAVTGANFGAANAVTGFTEIWNGTKWQVAATPWPKATGQAVLWGASCYGAHSCEAVGFAGAKLGYPPVDATAVSYRGAIGTLQAVAKPVKGDSSIFATVSCLPWGTCIAVGDIGKSTATIPAVMTGVWNGKSWKLDPGF